MINIESVQLNRKNKQIFSDLTLLVEKDEKVLIQGKSGIGKTTLFKILLGFETIDKGNITFNGLDLAPDHNIPVELYWHCRNIKSKLLTQE